MDEVKCKDCGVSVIWVMAENKKRMICDPEMISIVDDKGKLHMGHVPHWAKCPRTKYLKKTKELIHDRGPAGKTG